MEGLLFDSSIVRLKKTMKLVIAKHYLTECYSLCEKHLFLNAKKSVFQIDFFQSQRGCLIYMMKKNLYGLARPTALTNRIFILKRPNILFLV